MYKVQIQEGSCSCPDFTESRIPCRHILKNFKLEWEDSWHLIMTNYRMNTPICVLLKRASRLRLRQLQYHSIRHLDQIRHLDAKAVEGHHELAKHSATVFIVDDISLLENVNRKVHTIHSELLSTSSILTRQMSYPFSKTWWRRRCQSIGEKRKS